ncbi:anti-sigma B factor RsbW [Peribacillus psychrosaccharolyticus]|uniref:Serine-protein kinase RsbW n=1 Tax=Peribacillus psychrosaccharolyticus TaxID=1407 RepID=A0A974RYR5_PERPY|nr:anti-sigma B factor RsbW [Peribacillus psychrosaccharolyticus]MEC2058003.1 anti-sigma B factor RsbW [Peribacillus psychrosaccharolyticus]MED3745388.1 anti-sigma B factor RsbW [Peribacillus psychrosaccharolyticus]QQS98617.1 anti-sigma B factor RsbW [Peribacillus psychrosaccharolyticus]
MSQAYDYIEMKIPAKPNFIGVIRLTLSGIASRMGFTYDEIEDLKIATSEACTNAVQHAYKDNQGEVKISFGLYEDRLEVMVSDSGESCDFDEVRQGLGPYENGQNVEFLREGGLGLYLIETLMDEVKIHQHEGVTVFMTKFLEREQVEMDAKTLST